MNETLEKQLTSKFPELFKEYFNQNGWFMFGIEAPDGWYGIIEKALEDIQRVYDLEDVEFKQNFSFVQIKEKFGGLRLYCGITTNAIDAIISQAEKDSFTICQVCGNSGELRCNRGWYATLCDKCQFIS